MRSFILFAFASPQASHDGGLPIKIAQGIALRTYRADDPLDWQTAQSLCHMVLGGHILPGGYMPAHLTAHIGQLIRRILLYVVRQLGCFRIQADIFRIRLSEAAAGTRDVLIVHMP